GLVGVGGWVGEKQLLADVAPEQVLDESQCRRRGAEQRLGLFDHPPVLLRHALECFQICHNARSVKDTELPRASCTTGSYAGPPRGGTHYLRAPRRLIRPPPPRETTPTAPARTRAAA